jgi:hypothetical protein
MKFGVRHLLLVVFLVAFALGTRGLAIAIENDAATGIGVLVAAFLASFWFTILGTKLWKAWLIGVATTMTMCVADGIERAYHSPAMEYLWRHPIQAQYAADAELGMIVTLIFTFFATIVAGVGVGTGKLVRNFLRKSPDKT